MSQKVLQLQQCVVCQRVCAYAVGDSAECPLYTRTYEGIKNDLGDPNVFSHALRCPPEAVRDTIHRATRAFIQECQRSVGGDDVWRKGSDIAQLDAVESCWVRQRSHILLWVYQASPALRDYAQSPEQLAMFAKADVETYRTLALALQHRALALHSSDSPLRRLLEPLPDEALNSVYRKLCPDAAATTFRNSVVDNICEKFPDIDTALRLLTVEILRDVHQYHFQNKGSAKNKAALAEDLTEHVKRKKGVIM